MLRYWPDGSSDYALGVLLVTARCDGHRGVRRKFVDLHVRIRADFG